MKGDTAMNNVDLSIAKGIRENICQTCKYTIRQDNSYLVDCVCNNGHACGNAYQREGQCDSYRPNVPLIRLKQAALDAIKEFNRVHELYPDLRADDPSWQHEELVKAATRSCCMTEAYAIMLNLGQDFTAEMLREELKGGGNE